MGAREVLTIAIVMLATYIASVELPFEVRGGELPEPAPYAGPYAVNDKLQAATLRCEGKLSGPESVILDAAGNMYAFEDTGRVVMVAAGSDCTVSEWAYVGGRPLAGQFAADGGMYVADVHKGLLYVDATTRQPTVVAGRTNDGRRIALADAVDIGPDGMVYFSDACKLGPEVDPDVVQLSLMCLVEGSRSGRLLRYDPRTRVTDTLVDGLIFANGVAVSADGDFVLVADTFNSSVVRYHLKGPRAGQYETALWGVPGFIDGISRAPDGGFWLAIVVPVPNAVLRAVIANPYAAAFAMRLPRAPTGKHAMVVKVDAELRPIASYHDPSGKVVHTIPSAIEHDGKLYLGSFDKHVGVLAL